MERQSMRSSQNWLLKALAVLVCAAGSLSACARHADPPWSADYRSVAHQFQLIREAQAQQTRAVPPHAKALYANMQSLWNRMGNAESNMMQSMHGRGMMGRHGMMGAGMMNRRGMMQFHEMNQQMLSYCIGMQQIFDQAGNARMAGMYAQMADRMKMLVSQSKPSNGVSAPAPAGTPAPADGAATFAANCAGCHGASGTGVGSVFPPLRGSSVFGGSPDVPIKIVLLGLQGPITVSGVHYKGFMPAFGGTLTDGQIAAALTYVHSLPGNSGASVTPEQVRNVRKQTAARGKAFTARDLGLH